MSVYKYLDYRDFLLREIKSRKKINSKQNFAGLAQALRVQKTLVSKVLKGEANLNADQIFLACEYLGLDESEAEFISLLLELDRCSVAKRKQALKRKIQTIRQRELRPAKVLKDVEIIPTEDQPRQQFYLDPVAQLVHAFLIIPRYAASPGTARAELGIAPGRFEEILDLLERAGLVKRGSPLRVLKHETNLDPASPLQPVYQQLVRMRGLDRLAKTSGDQKFLFSVLLTIDEATQEKLKELIVSFLESARQQVGVARPTAVHQLNIDFFPW